MRMLRILIWLIALGGVTQLTAQGYQYEVNLRKCSQPDKLDVNLKIELPLKDSADFHFAKIVPGTYSISDFGRFVDNFQAFDQAGNVMEVLQKDTNVFTIPSAQNLDRITYQIRDTWDEEDFEADIFEPGGTGWEEGEYFAINWFGVLGFFPEYENEDFEIRVAKPEDFQGVSALKIEKSDSRLDIIRAGDFDEIADSPTLYGKIDQKTIKIGDARVRVSVLGDGRKFNAEKISEEIRSILVATQDYLGGSLPVDHYDFLFYFFDFFSLSGSYGALEHNYSSFYSLPSSSLFLSTESLREISSHEFFHIVTPLTLHSEFIQNFDFTAPRMSQHLWLYEGATEYFSQHVQATGKLTSQQGFLNNLEDIVRNARQYNDTLPFTTMSQLAHSKWASQYGNVYKKGALISLCLDLILMEKSGGKMTLIGTLQELGKQFGKDKPFPEDSLFQIITAATYPDLGKFFNKHVAGGEPLPLKQCLSFVGVDFSGMDSVKEFTTGGVRLKTNFNDKIEVYSTYMRDEFGKAIGLERGDIIQSWNGKELAPYTYQEILYNWRQEVKEGDSVDIVLLKPGPGLIDPSRVEQKIRVKVIPKIVLAEPEMEFMDNPSPGQLRLRKAWLREN